MEDNIMATPDTVKVQAYIQAILTKVNDLVEEAVTNAGIYKTLYDDKGVNLTGTNLSAQNVTDINSMITALTAVQDLTIMTTLEDKNIPSQDLEPLN